MRMANTTSMYRMIAVFEIFTISYIAYIVDVPDSTINI